MASTSIEWTDAVWNPLRGCSEVSPGCRNCYAAVMAHRFSGPGMPYQGLVKELSNGKIAWSGKVRMVPEKLDEPLRWRKPRRIFVNSMSDLFHEDVPDEFIDRVFAVMGVAHWHRFQVLTKRAERMADYFAETWQVPEKHAEKVYGIDLPYQPAYVEDRWEKINAACDDIPTERLGKSCWDEKGKLIGRPSWPRRPYPNVEIGVSVEDQARADERIPHLLEVPAAVRFLSIEPMLGPIDLSRSFPCGYYCDPGIGHVDHPFLVSQGQCNGGGISWVICGGESGPRARPMHPRWVRSIRDQCQVAGVPFFFKQWGRFVPPDQIDDARGYRLVYVDARTGSVTPAISPYEPGCPCDHMPSDAEMVDVGKSAAGRLLDDRTWDEFSL